MFPGITSEHDKLSPLWKESLCFHWSITSLYVAVYVWTGGRYFPPFMQSIVRGQNNRLSQYSQELHKNMTNILQCFLK